MATEVRTDNSRGLDRGTLVAAYRNIYLSRRVDDKEIQLKRQNKIYFQINSVGHEAVTTAAGMILKPGYDWFRLLLPRPGALPPAGCNPLRDVPPGGRREGRSGLGRPPDAVPLGLQAPEPHLQVLVHGHAIPARRRRGRGAAGAWAGSPSWPATAGSTGDEVGYVSGGEGQTSEGEFWEALSTASNLKLPVLFLIEDNGYAISVPGRGQHARRLDLEAGARLPAPLRRRGRRHRFPRVLRRAALRRGVLPHAHGPGARPRASVIRPVQPLALGRRERTTGPRRSATREAEKDPLQRLSRLLLEEGILARSSSRSCTRRSTPRSTTRRTAR